MNAVEPTAPAAGSAHQPAVLAYADSPARQGIAYELAAGTASFLIPPPPWYRRPEFGVALALIIQQSIWTIVTTIRSPAQAFPACLAILAGGGVCIGIAVLIGWQWRRPGFIELTPLHLRLRNIRLYQLPQNSGARAADVRYPRDLVYDIHYVSHSGNIVIHVRGYEMIELRPSPDPHTVRWIAEGLSAALATPPPISCGSQPVPARRGGA